MLLLACDLSDPAEEQAPPIFDDDGVVLAHSCPGGPGCRVATGVLRVGAAARAITPVVERFTDDNGNQRRDPEEPFEDDNGDGEHQTAWLAGFDIGRQATGVHDDVWSRVIVLERGDVRIAFVSLDLVGLFQDDVNLIRTAVDELAFDHVVVATTHDHETQDTMGIWGEDPGTTGRDPAYIALIVDQTRAALEEAVLALTEVSGTFAQVDASDLVADSREPEVIAGTLTALEFRALGDDAVVAHWVIFGNHPESLGGDNTELTSDYPHFLRAHLEAKHPGSTAIFSSGNLGGLMNPLHLEVCPDEEGVEQCPVGEFARAEALGTELAQRALDGLASGEDLGDELGFARRPYFVPVDNLPLFLALQVGLITRDAFFEGERLSPDQLVNVGLDDATSGVLEVDSEVNVLRVGPLDLVTIPGELYPELWLGGVERPEGRDFDDAEVPVAFSSMSARIPVAINNANDALGYIIPKSQYDREPPRAYRDGGQYGEQNCVGPDHAVRLEAALEALFSL